jgi:hypothetical protein
MLEKHLLVSHRLTPESPTSSPFPVEPRVERQTIFTSMLDEVDLKCRSSNTHGVPSPLVSGCMLPHSSRGCSPAHWPSAGNQGAQLEQFGNGEAPPGRLWGGLASTSLFSLSTPADCEVALASVSLLSLSTPATGPVAKQQVRRASRAISEQT